MEINRLMLYVIVIWEMFLAFIKRNSKIVSFVILLTLFLIAAFSYGIADSELYLGRYNHYDVAFLYDQTEPLYTWVVKMANMVNMPYRLFLGLEYLFILACFSFFVKKYTKKYNFVLFLYIIWPFCRDVAVLRTTLGAAFVYIGFSYLLRGGKRNLIIYSICVLLGGLFHYGMLFFFIMIPIEIVKSEETLAKNKLFRLFLILFIVEIVVFRVFPQLPFTGTLMNKINFVLERSVNGNSLVTAPGALRTLFMFLIYYFLHRKVLHKLKASNDQLHIAMSEKIFYINSFVLLIIPVLSYIPDLARIQQCVALLSYVEFSWYFSKTVKANVIKKKELIFYGLCIGYATIYLFIIVLKTDQFETVFRALFENNLLNKYFWFS